MRGMVWTLLVGLAACAPPTTNAGLAQNGCAASARSTWIAAERNSYTAEAFTSGPTCAQAVATIVVRAAEGTALMSQAAPVAHLFGLNEAKDAAGMNGKLAEWLDQKSSPFATADKLPAWPEGAEAPNAGEFPFHPDVDRDFYEQLRAETAPMFCYVQGMESQACYALREGALERVGVQQFPG